MFLNVYFAARFILSSNSNNCCLLYFNANIMCSFTKKLKLLGDVGLAISWSVLVDTFEAQNRFVKYDNEA